MANQKCFYFSLKAWNDIGLLFKVSKFLIASFLSNKILEIRFAENVGIQQYCSTKVIFLLPLEVLNLQRLIITLAHQLNLWQKEEGVLLLSFGRESLLEVAEAAFSWVQAVGGGLGNEEEDLQRALVASMHSELSLKGR